MLGGQAVPSSHSGPPFICSVTMVCDSSLSIPGPLTANPNQWHIMHCHDTMRLQVSGKLCAAHTTPGPQQGTSSFLSLRKGVLLLKAQAGLHPGPAGHTLTFLSSFPEEAAALDKAKVAAKGKERVRRVRDESEKVVKQWEEEQDDVEKGTDNELSNGESPALAASGQEENGKTGVEKNTSLRRELGAVGKNSRDDMKRRPGEAGKSSGGAGKELSKSELREIYRRPSDLDQKPSGELVKNGSEDKGESLSEAERRESEDLEEIELEETETESAEKTEQEEKEDE